MHFIKYLQIINAQGRKTLIKEKKKEKKKKINGLGRSVQWSEELSFRANHRYIMIVNT